MDDDDFRALIELLQAQLREVGAAELADDRHYLRTDGDGEEARLFDPQKRLIQMLSAFERKLAVEDRNTYDKALERMDRTLRGEGPRGAVFERARDEDRAAIRIDLSQAPDLRELRDQISHLIGQLMESRLPPGRIG